MKAIRLLEARRTSLMRNLASHGVRKFKVCTASSSGKSWRAHSLGTARRLYHIHQIVQGVSGAFRSTRIAEISDEFGPDIRASESEYTRDVIISLALLTP